VMLLSVLTMMSTFLLLEAARRAPRLPSLY
jgi:hypothetical protein